MASSTHDAGDPLLGLWIDRCAHQRGHAGFVLLAVPLLACGYLALLHPPAMPADSTTGKLMLGAWFADPSWLGDFVNGQLVYAMVILSFLGGVHWGAGMLSTELSAVDTKKALMWGVTPSLIAWSATLFGGFGFAVLMAGFVAALQVDKQMYPAYGMPEWLLVLRKKLTIVVVLSLILTVIGANLRG